jgi:hypothetical protein
MTLTDKSAKPTNANLGASHELVVAAHLLGLGYEVFRSVGPNSKADLVARLGGDVCFIEVRQIVPRADGELRFLTKKDDVCDYYAGVSEEGMVAYSPSKKQRDFIRKPRRKWEE